ncbi:MAG: hypothetical protein AB7O67_03535 [Vicinamibacterales bacterium]
MPRVPFARLARVCSLVVCAVLTATAAYAQDVPAFGLAPKADPAVHNGKVVFAEAMVDRVGMRFLLPEINILQPVALAVATAREDDRVKVVLGRDRWDETIREQTTSDGATAFALHTQGDIRITLQPEGDEPVHVLLAAWVGDDVTPEMAPILETQAPASGGWMTWVLGAGAVLLLAVAALFVLRRRSGPAAAAAILLAVVCSGGAVAAQGGGTTVLGGGPPAPIPPPSSLPRGALPPRTAVERTWNQIHNPNSPWNRSLDRFDDEFSRYENASRPFEAINTAAGLGRAAREFWEASDAFSNEDAGYTPDLNPDGMPDLPVGCAMTDNAAGCAACYQQAQGKLQGMMLLLERLRAIGESTRRYTTAALAFGDNVSGIHGVSGLAWQSQRGGIVQQLAGFERTYESKRQDMMGSLRRALDDVAACEAEYFDNPDWFNRYGFIYYQFMDARYKH